MNKTAIIASTDKGVELGLIIQKEFQKSIVVSTRSHSKVTQIESIHSFLENNFSKFDSFVFIGALGICVRSIAPYIENKTKDPAVINIDDAGTFVQAVLSGHLGGANALTQNLSKVIGAQAVITTSSDTQNIWALDTLPATYNWKSKSSIEMNKIISLFVNNKPTALLLDIKDKGCTFLERNKPDFVTIHYRYNDIDFSKYELLIAVTYKVYEAPIPALYYYAPVITMGMGCSRGIEYDLLENSFRNQLQEQHIAVEAIKSLGSLDVKHDEEAFITLATTLKIPFITFTAEELNSKNAINPSEVVMSKLGVYSVSEAAAMLLAQNNEVILEKKKIHLSSGKKHTIALSLDAKAQRKAEIIIVGAGPGAADLISVKGKELLEDADLILYAGSLIPIELTHYAKPSAIVRNSASMTLEEQIEIMCEHYEKGNLIVRLQSGDPSIYGAIQEQMTIFDEKGMEYSIVPGISSFQAAAAYLKSEFTIPEVVQSIILTRGEGKTPLPENEKLNEMAKHRATMCIFLSATIAKSVQEQLLEHYPEDTPVAVLYRVTWQDERVFVGKLTELAQIIRDNKLTLTTLVIVGAAIGARKNRSYLYSPEWKHIFRTGKEVKINNN
ncbi:precorrin-4 C(11)-methyltransferase [Flavobacterium oreochromis]|uniref:Precorrin-4 C(11)-methyltransferase n=1 Tax=Flavobacterium oreochromis TaxID=2906078 RepID=A0ABW8P915_9FLAO|nr:precorrin-4 C(11)-methyltransferase [Flavobacterium oreochromis]OWP75919.1 precorrin-4 C(11)-methyltransferase [Flavobacterium oreochromis]QYS86390.1 precorrin-4 C(11)-methyltransferase [Flavobacterium oreochromis]